MLSRMKKAILGKGKKDKKKGQPTTHNCNPDPKSICISRSRHLDGKYLYNSSKFNVCDRIKITVSAAEANLAARTYFEKEITHEQAKSLCVTVSGINVYVNPTATATNNNSHNAFGEKNIYVNPVAAQTLQNEEQVIAAWVEPCFSGLSLRSSRYNDGECFLSFRLLAQAMLMASKLTKDVSADSTATTAKYCQYNGEWKILYIFAGVQGWDCNKTKPKEIKITGTKNDVRNMIESIFGAQGCRQDELEFQTVDGMLDVWARPDMERLNRGDLMVALAMPHIENGEVQNGIE